MRPGDGNCDDLQQSRLYRTLTAHRQLSFSTKRSAQHPRVEKVRQPLGLVRQREPSMVIDREFQVDAALIPEVARKKVKKTTAVVDNANVLIFLDLDSGNTGYKLAQWLGGARAIGPFLQGFAKPISDLSRVASEDDIVTTCAVILAITVNGGGGQQGAFADYPKEGRL